MRDSFILLSYQDSNLDRQNQKLQCYHYTIRQSYLPKRRIHYVSNSLKRCKVMKFLGNIQNYTTILHIFYIPISISLF